MPEPSFELVFAALIIVALVGIALFVARRQILTLRRLRTFTQFSTEERRFFRAQAWRRLVNSGLMIVIAALLTGTYWFGQERRAAELSQERPAAEREAQPRLTEEDSRFLKQYSTFWMVFALLLLAMLGLAFYDIWSIRSFARNSFRQIQADRRAMIEEQVAEIRRQRNGF